MEAELQREKEQNKDNIEEAERLKAEYAEMQKSYEVCGTRSFR